LEEAETRDTSQGRTCNTSMVMTTKVVKGGGDDDDDDSDGAFDKY
jgi:hypothetical protein